MQIIGILQNAYGGGSRYCTGEDLWVNRGLAYTPSMKRLLKFTKSTPFKWWFDNASANCGRRSSSKFTGDHDHVRWVLRRPHNLVVAFGTVAEKVCLDVVQTQLLIVPHPASRTLTNELYEEARDLLIAGFNGRIALRQRLGWVEHENIG